MPRTLRLGIGDLVYRPMRAESAARVHHVPNITWLYLTPRAAIEAEPDCVAVPFFVQEPLEFVVGSAEDIIALTNHREVTPRTAASAFVNAVRAISRDGFDGVALRSDGKVSAVFIRSPEHRLRRVEEAFRQGNDDDAPSPKL